VVFAVWSVEVESCVPPVAADVVNHPAKVNPLLVGAGICVEVSLVLVPTIAVVFAGAPVKFWLNVIMIGLTVKLTVLVIEVKPVPLTVTVAL
jgi:hypothetical protein